STDLDNEIKRAGDLPTQAVFASLIARKARQHFYPVKAFTRRIRVNCSHGAFMPCVHGLQHVHYFSATHFAHYYAIRPHAQAVAYQVANADQAVAIVTTLPRLEPHDVKVV